MDTILEKFAELANQNSELITQNSELKAQNELLQKAQLDCQQKLSSEMKTQFTALSERVLAVEQSATAKEDEVRQAKENISSLSTAIEDLKTSLHKRQRDDEDEDPSPRPPKKKTKKTVAVPALVTKARAP